MFLQVLVISFDPPFVQVVEQLLTDVPFIAE